ncbi:four helix bundle protein [Adhaeribacter arboris]|uniref:Four helix bundle protein n=1 Tax=Adhaeribacter arboris TaxID=2072846 RepID=A0A2T2YHC7_9BACT|nr:four helix bundle protein [Adhaeribacter arboris]PSR54913.1 four helix bundle protein [Adhaeribacter arboris]
MADSLVAQKSYQFALRIVKLYQHLKEQKKEYILAKQLLRSGTSIGANVEEAVAAQSKADFIHKLHISLKETRETSYWLRLLKDANYLDDDGYKSIYADCLELQKMLSSSILTSKKNNS